MMIYPTMCRYACTLVVICTIQVPPTFATDMGIHSVPLDHIVRDDFPGGVIPLTQASSELIASLKDRIPPLTNPQYGTAQDASWLKNDDLVLGFVENGDSRAYPTRIFNFHEIVNDTVGGTLVVIFSDNAGPSGAAFDATAESTTLSFFLEQEAFKDYQTRSTWNLAGEATDGPLKGTRLTPLPARSTFCFAWVAAFPDTTVYNPKS